MEIGSQRRFYCFDVIEGPFNLSHSGWVYTCHKRSLPKEIVAMAQIKRWRECNGCCPTRLIIVVALILWAGALDLSDDHSCAPYIIK
jgi:hypothetical protein